MDANKVTFKEDSEDTEEYSSLIEEKERKVGVLRVLGNDFYMGFAI